MERKHPRRHYVKRILRDVWDHPANRGHRPTAIARSTWWQATKRVRRSPRAVPFWGMTLLAHPDSASASNVVYFTERFDWEAMGFLERYLRPGDGFLDVGANIGTYTLLAASLTGPTGRIEAIEPLERACERLRANVDRNRLDRVTVHQVAVGDRDGSVDFVDFDVSSVVDHEMDRRGRVPVTVPIRRIDGLVDPGGFAAGKLDVEGLELQALRGASSLIEQRDPPVWLVEVMDWQLAKHGDRATDLVAWMGAHGYGPHRWDPEAAILRDVSSGWDRYDDLLFVAADHLETVRDRLAEEADPASRQR